MPLSFFFFFSSRRRHTRWTGDWSSDVCSSDLDPHLLHAVALPPDLVGGPAHGHDAGLQVLRPVELLVGALEAEPAHRHAEHRLRPLEHAPRGRIALVEPQAHPRTLDALAGEQQCDRTAQGHSHSSRHAAQVRPEPNPAIRTMSPRCSRSSASASCSASGTVAVDVLPKRSMLTITFSIGRPTRCAAASMIRRLAWCGTQRSMSSMVLPAAAETACAWRMKMSVANLKTSGPFIPIRGAASFAA